MQSTDHIALIQTYLQNLVNTQSIAQPQLQQALHYAVVLGGKRIRPQLSLAVAQLFGVPAEQALAGACAVELIHCYSLIHDDLPCMDNDALRRGQPTCHIQFDEATALLTGDYLQTMAMQLLVSQAIAPSVMVKQVQLLAQASCAMVDGQSLDLQAEKQPITLEQLQLIHTKKTAALIEAALLIGASYAQPTSEQYTQLSQLAGLIGLAYQVQDDILDITASTEVLGKPAGSDLVHDKATYPKLLGLQGAKDKLAQLQQQIDCLMHQLCPPNTPTTTLQQLIAKVLQRQF